MKFLLPTCLAALSSVSFAKEISFNQCPAAVKATIRAELDGGRIDDIDLIQVNGAKRYIVDIDGPAGRDLTLRIGGGGKLLLASEDIRLNQSPAAVRGAIKKLLKSGWSVDDVDRETQGTQVRYRVEIDRWNANDLEVLLDASGKILKQRVLPHDAR